MHAYHARGHAGSMRARRLERFLAFLFFPKSFTAALRCRGARGVVRRSGHVLGTDVCASLT